jgi:hypothetical protein
MFMLSFTDYCTGHVYVVIHWLLYWPCLCCHSLTIVLAMFILHYCDSVWFSWIDVNLCMVLSVCLYMCRCTSNYQRGIGIPLTDLTRNIVVPVAIQVLNFKGHNNFVVCLCLIIRWLFVLLILVNHHCLHNLSFHNIGLVCKIKVVRPSRSTYIGDRLNKWYVFQSLDT